MRRRRRRLEEEALLEEEENFMPIMEEESWTPPNPELLNLKSEKTRELRESVREFADDNPEISAQMIKNWLNGGDSDG